MVRVYIWEKENMICVVRVYLVLSPIYILYELD